MTAWHAGPVSCCRLICCFLIGCFVLFFFASFLSTCLLQLHRRRPLLPLTPIRRVCPNLKLPAYLLSRYRLLRSSPPPPAYLLASLRLRFSVEDPLPPLPRKRRVWVCGLQMDCVLYWRSSLSVTEELHWLCVTRTAQLL